jgi:hypothetical protein
MDGSRPVMREMTRAMGLAGDTRTFRVVPWSAWGEE